MKNETVKQISLRKVIQGLIVWLLIINIMFMTKGLRNEVWQSEIGPLPFSLFWFEIVYLFFFVVDLIFQKTISKIAVYTKWICFGLAAFAFIPYILYSPILLAELFSNHGDTQDIAEFTYLLSPFLLSYFVFFEMKREKEELNN